MAAKNTPTLDLNAATRDELVAAGVSAKGADALIARRKEVGSFASHDALEGIPGLSADAADTLRRVTTVSAADAEVTLDAPAGRAERAGEAGGKPAAKPAPATAAPGPTLVKQANSEEEGKARVYAAQTGEASGAAAARTGEEGKVRVYAAPAGEAAGAYARTGEAGREALGATTAATAGSARHTLGVAREALDSTRAGLDAGAAGIERAQEMSAMWLFWWPEQMSEAFRTAAQLSACRTMKEYVELQSNFARSSMERFSRLFAAQMGMTFGGTSSGAVAGRTSRRVNVY